MTIDKDLEQNIESTKKKAKWGCLLLRTYIRSNHFICRLVFLRYVFQGSYTCE